MVRSDRVHAVFLGLGAIRCRLHLRNKKEVISWFVVTAFMRFFSVLGRYDAGFICATRTAGAGHGVTRLHFRAPVRLRRVQDPRSLRCL